MTRYDMYKKGFFILISGECFDLCEMDEPKHLTVLKAFKTERSAKMYAKKNNFVIINE